MTMLSRVAGVVGLVLLSAWLTACTHVRPWERGKLAHPTMVGPNLPGVAEEHVYSVQEGAVGGGASAESGCGCN
ncbi:MAG: hypothetical protein QOI41_2109 [Myxococcales bacterium]|jgi:hypothetical protein|nr:hypothetical protein [Myxococcales bacterium]